MTSITSKIPSRSLKLLFLLHRAPPLTCSLCTSTPSTTAETQTQKLERIADQLLSLSKLERYDYSILFRHKMGLNQYGPAISGLESSSGSSSSAGSESADAKAAEKTAFDVKLEKYDAAAKIKVIKEIRSFTDLGLKEAKDLVEKAPIVVKKGVTKEEADSIVEKLKVVGATVFIATSAEDSCTQFVEPSTVDGSSQIIKTDTQKLLPSAYASKRYR
ncbi:unnamed protein product [Ilex paraguariensis]|uniref:Large ribosomal subunit protein bL12c n=1 Tax=Ilex paraguariensis TaxID=185542 RepID=A0ABC8RTT8_9AQUA